jgi:hypothetical protein
MLLRNELLQIFLFMQLIKTDTKKITIVYLVDSFK